MPRIDVQTITDDFINDGFFSEYLPPMFSIRNAFDPCSVSLNSTPDYIEPISFNMSRFLEEGNRRTIYVPEFASYLSTVKFMKEKDLIKDLIDLSVDSHSFSPLVQKNGELTRHERDYNFGITLDDIDQDAFKSTYIPNVVNKINRARGSKGVLCLDISSFYSSIYSHLIPAIKLGYEDAQIQYKAQKSNNNDPIISDDYRTYVKLDEYVRNMNVGRTNGLLPGILVSQFLSEALLSRVDKELESQGLKFVRYVDDYEVFIYDEAEIEKVQNIVVSVLKKYFLSLNNEKTKYSKFPFYVVENLEKLYSDYTGESADIADLMKLFNVFFKLENSGTKGAIRYLVKSIQDDFKTPNNRLLVSYLFNILVNDSRSLVKVCELLISRKNQILIGANEINLIDDLLNKNINANNHLETLWLLYLRKKLTRKRLPAKFIHSIIESNNELAKILIVEEYYSKMSKTLKDKILETANSWLLCYQLFYHDYIDKREFSRKTNIKHNLPFYAKLKQKSFTFYKR